MGVHIILRSAAGEEHAGWDSCRMGGDRDFVSLANSLDKIAAADASGWLEDAFRPDRFDVWEASVREEFAEPDRYLLLLALLEADPSFWVYFSF